MTTLTKPKETIQEIGPPMIHLVKDNPDGTPGEYAICGAGRATKIPPPGEPVNCLVCYELRREALERRRYEN